MRPDRTAFASHQRPPLADPVVDHFVEDKPVHVSVRRPVLFGTKSQASLQHADHHLRLLPELLLMVIDPSGVRSFHVHTAVLPVDAVIPTVIHGPFDHRAVLVPVRIDDIGRMGQKPSELHIVAGRGVVPGVRLLSPFSEPVPAPDDVELDLGSNLPIHRELRNTRSILRMQYSPGQDFNIFNQRPAVNAPAGTFIQVRERLHEVHVDVERLPVASLRSGTAQIPVALEHFEEPAVHRIGPIFLDEIERLLRVLLPARIPRRHCVFGEGVQGETEAVHDLLVDHDLPLPVGGPEESPLLPIPELGDREIDSMLGVPGACATTVAGPVRGRHRVDRSHLRQHRFLIIARVVAVPVEVRIESAVDIVLAAVQPEGQQLRRQVCFALFQAEGNLVAIHGHPFMAPTLIPLMNCDWARKKITMFGSITSSDPAINVFHSVIPVPTICDFNRFRPSVSVAFSVELM